MLFVRLSGPVACWQFGDAAAWPDLRALPTCENPCTCRPAGRSDDSRTFVQFMSPCLAVNLAHRKRCWRRPTPQGEDSCRLTSHTAVSLLSSFNCSQCQWSSYYCCLYSQTKHERTESNMQTHDWNAQIIIIIIMKHFKSGVNS